MTDPAVRGGTDAYASQSPGKRVEEIVPAATVVLLRDGAGGLETLMCRRTTDVSFGGFWVFPGGRVEPDDLRDGEDPAGEAPARRAAVREAREEVGLQVPDDGPVALSHWTPPDFVPRKFTTWVFLATAPDAEVTVDRGEIEGYAWLDPAEVLRRRDRGDMVVAPPTWVTLWTLTHHPTVGSALAAAAAGEPERFNTRRVIGPEGEVLLQRGDAGYESFDADAPGPRHRLYTYESGWTYIREL